MKNSPYYKVSFRRLSTGTYINWHMEVDGNLTCLEDGAADEFVKELARDYVNTLGPTWQTQILRIEKKEFKRGVSKAIKQMPMCMEEEELEMTEEEIEAAREDNDPLDWQ